MESDARVALHGIDPRRLLQARLWVGRLGESDVMGWWRSDALLGPDGAYVGPRVLPKTHRTARARIVFAVAAHACRQRHPDPQAHHLFTLLPEDEDRFDLLLVEHLADTALWEPLVARLEGINKDADSRQVLAQAGVVTDEDLRYVEKAELGPEGRSLLIRVTSPDEALRRLAAGFTRGTSGTLVVPYASAR